jgi:PIN domain nuclease of toxin-antitoxin system
VLVDLSTFAKKHQQVASTKPFLWVTTLHKSTSFGNATKMQRQNNKSIWIFVLVANYELSLRLVNTKLERRREMGSSKCF